MRCQHCPVRKEIDCLGNDPRFPFFCEWAAAGDPEKIRVIVGRSEAEVNSHYPSLTEQAVNAARAVASFAASGFKIADEAEVDRRLGICRECDQFDTEQIRCRACGCCTNLKTRAQTQHCPIGKW